MLRKRDIKNIEQISNDIIMMNDKEVLTDALKQIHHIALLTNNDLFLKATEGDFHGDMLGIIHSEGDKKSFKVYTNYGNTVLGYITPTQAEEMAKDVVRDAKRIYRRHRNANLARSANRDTPYGLRNRMAFLVGNLYGITKEQKEANAHGTKDFYLYSQGGYAQADQDYSIIRSLQHGDYQTGYPSDFIKGLGSSDKIADTIRLGKRLGRKESYCKLVHSLDDLAWE